MHVEDSILRVGEWIGNKYTVGMNCHEMTSKQARATWGCDQGTP